MKNKTLVWLWISGIGMCFASGFISGFNGYQDGLSSLLLAGGMCLSFVMQIWAMIRLWRTDSYVPRT